MHICIYAYMHICTYAYMHKCIYAYIRTLDMQAKQQLTPALDMHATTTSNRNKCNNNIHPHHEDFNSVITRTNAVVTHRLKWAPVNDRQRGPPRDPETLCDLIPATEVYTAIVFGNILIVRCARFPV